MTRRRDLSMLALPSQRQQSEPILPASKVLGFTLPLLRLGSGVSALLEEVHSFSPAGSAA